MSLLQSENQKKRWAKIPKEARSEIGRSLAILKWKNMSHEDKMRHVRKMVVARLKKTGENS